MNRNPPLSRRTSSTHTPINPYHSSRTPRSSRLHPKLAETQKYITKEEFDEILEKQFQAAVAKLEQDLMNKMEEQIYSKLEETNESITQLEEELIKKMTVLSSIIPTDMGDNKKEMLSERNYFRNEYIKFQNGSFTQYTEFSKIIAEYQKIIVNLIDTIINKESISDDTSRSLRNIGILQRNRSQESIKLPDNILQ